VTFIGSIDITSFKELRFLRQSQTLGITLKGIKQLLQLLRDGQHPCKSVRELAHRHLTDVDLEMRQLRFPVMDCAICYRVGWRPAEMSDAR